MEVTTRISVSENARSPEQRTLPFRSAVFFSGSVIDRKTTGSQGGARKRKPSQKSAPSLSGEQDSGLKRYRDTSHSKEDRDL